MAAGLIRTARDKAEMTQAELAASAGVTQQSISAYETGRKDPTLSTLQRLIAAAGFEMRINLAPLDDHDATLETYMKALDPERRAALEAERQQRAADARLRRVRGH